MPRVKYFFNPCSDDPIVVRIEYDEWYEVYVFRFEGGRVIVEYDRRRTHPSGPPDLFRTYENPHEVIETICEAISHEATDPFRSSMLSALAIMLGAPIDEDEDKAEEVA